MDAQSPKLSDSERMLIQAAVKGDAEKTRQLLSSGVDVNVRNAETHPLGMEWNTTPLMCAAANGHLNVVRVLIDAGADLSAAGENNKVDGGGGSQALHYATKNNHVEVARVLLDAGADPNALGNHAWTPLTCALRPMSLAGVRLLLEHGAQANLQVRRKDYEPPLYAAACVINNTSSMVRRNGKMVLEVAEIWERKDEVLEIFRLLIAAGADPNATGARNQSALQNLVRGTEMPDDLRLALIELLMNAGAGPNSPDKDGLTPISTAERYENPRVIELLNRPVPPSKTDVTAVAASKPVQKTKKTKATKAGAGHAVGAADFLKFISDGEPEWALVSIQAPIQQVTEALAAFLKLRNVKPNVPLRAATKGMDEIFKAIAVVAVASNPWTIVFLSLFYANEQIINHATLAAGSLSSQLKTRAIAYAAEGTSDEASILRYEKGNAIDKRPQAVDDDEADEIFRNHGVYLPACFPKSKAADRWLAVEKASAAQIERADLIIW